MITTPPSPAAAEDEASFVAELRRLRTWSGMSFRQLERQAAAAGDTLPASTVATMLGKNRLPRVELLVAFLRACGLDEAGMGPWLTTRAMIAGPAAAAVTRPRARPRWRRFILVVAALATGVAIGAALMAGLGSNSIEEYEEIEVLTP